MMEPYIFLVFAVALSTFASVFTAVKISSYTKVMGRLADTDKPKNLRWAVEKKYTVGTYSEWIVMKRFESAEAAGAYAQDNVDILGINSRVVRYYCG